MINPPRSSPLDPILVRRWLIVLVSFGLIWRLVRFAMAFPVWGDEAMLGLNVIDRSYAQLLEPLKYFQVAPVGFLWSLKLALDSFGVSDYVTRLPALIAGIIALLLFWRWARLLVSPHAAMFATGGLAVSGYIVRHGVEMKPYAFDLLAAVVLLWLATKYLLSGRSLWLIWLILAALVGSVCSYPQVFTAGAIAIALIARSFQRSWLDRILVIIYCLAVAGGFLAVMSLSGRRQYLASAAGMVPYWHDGFPPENPFKFVLWFLQIHTGNLFAYPVGGKNGASLITVIFFIIGLRVMWQEWISPIRLMLFAPFLLTFTAASLRYYPYGETRLSQHLAPIIILCAGAGLAVMVDSTSAVPAWRRRLTAAASLLLLIGVVRLTGNLIRPYKTKADLETRTAVRRLIAAAGNDPILVLHPAETGNPTLFWYLREGGRFYTHEINPSPQLLRGSTSAWAITCVAANAHLPVELAQKAGMKAVLWSPQDLQAGLKENGRVEIMHLVR